jgi:hypothetical protein
MRTSPHSRAILVLVVASLSALALAPSAGASGPTGCFNLTVKKFGSGLWVDLATVDEVTIAFSSSDPADGVTFVVKVVPSLCTVTAQLEQATLDLQEKSAQNQGSAPKAPVLP